VTTASEAGDLLAPLHAAGVGPGAALAVAVGAGTVAVHTGAVTVTAAAPGETWIGVVAAIEAALHPRWVWWSADLAGAMAAAGDPLAICWDLPGVHRLLFGGWAAGPARVWARLHGLATTDLPSLGQLGLLGADPMRISGDGGDPEDPVRPDGHLRPEWAGGGWAATPSRVARWAELAWRAMALQRSALDALGLADRTARSESAAELLCADLAHHGLPVDVAAARSIIEAVIGPRPDDEDEAHRARADRDDLVLRHARSRAGMDLRNPAHVKEMLRAVGVDVADTRAWRLDAYRGIPFVDALLAWRKSERVATTYGYDWLDRHVGTDGRLRGSWTACDGAAGRMTASSGLHNLPADMRSAVVAERGFAFVHADLGQIEPRVLAAVSQDPALSEATRADDLYAPIASQLGVERSVAKVAVLAAMYGQTSGTAAEALRGMERAFPVAMGFLRDADRRGRSGIDVRTVGGRLVRMRREGEPLDTRPVAAAARGRYARNALIQGAAAELFKTWAVTLRARLRGHAPAARIVLCLHDELLVHAPEADAPVVANLLASTLGEAAQRWMPDSRVRYVAQARVVRRWSDAK
jgi:DNA polymerase-1